ncbi:MAG: ATP-binding protein [Candidatus Sedimenticola sp. (ex Thyasira tokunagai)]
MSKIGQKERAMRESQNVEWKASWRDEYMKWICGFANGSGGVLVIGRNDAGEAVGVTDARQLLETLPNKVRDLLGIIVDVNLLHEAGRQLLEIVVEPYPYPISYKGQYHYRSGSTKQELKGAALDRFLLKKQGRHWDGVPVPQVGAADLDTAALAWFRRQAQRSQRLSAEILDETDAVLLDKLHLVEGGYLKRAALLLFHADPERFAVGAWLKVGFFDNNVDR